MKGNVFWPMKAVIFFLHEAIFGRKVLTPDNLIIIIAFPIKMS